jgi:hypothetical protein
MRLQAERAPDTLCQAPYQSEIVVQLLKTQRIKKWMLAAILAIFFVAPIAQADYGAISWDQRSGAYGFAAGLFSELDAKQKARDECRKRGPHRDCYSNLTIRAGECGTLVVSDPPMRRDYYGFYIDHSKKGRDQTEKYALEHCARGAGKDYDRTCKVVGTICTSEDDDMKKIDIRRTDSEDARILKAGRASGNDETAGEQEDIAEYGAIYIRKFGEKNDRNGHGASISRKDQNEADERAAARCDKYRHPDSRKAGCERVVAIAGRQCGALAVQPHREGWGNGVDESKFVAERLAMEMCQKSSRDERKCEVVQSICTAEALNYVKYKIDSRAESLEDLQKFVSKYRLKDPDNLVPGAESKLKDAQNEMAAAQLKKESDMRAAQKEREEAKKKQEYEQYRKDSKADDISDLQKFIGKYTGNDPDNLIPAAKARIATIQKQQAECKKYNCDGIADSALNYDSNLWSVDKYVAGSASNSRLKYRSPNGKSMQFTSEFTAKKLFIVFTGTIEVTAENGKFDCYHVFDGNKHCGGYGSRAYEIKEREESRARYAAERAAAPSPTPCYKGDKCYELLESKSDKVRVRCTKGPHSGNSVNNEVTILISGGNYNVYGAIMYSSYKSLDEAVRDVNACSTFLSY